MEMIKASGLKKYYVTDNYEVHALDGVSLSVEEGEFLAIIGTSGSGKTTLLQILGGLDEPTAGGVWIRGNSLKDMTEDERTIFRRRNIGFVFQQYNLIPVINVYENIVLPLRLDGAEIDEKLLEDIVRTLKIGEKLENLPEELSGGQQQRVQLQGVNGKAGSTFVRRANRKSGLCYKYGSNFIVKDLCRKIPPDGDCCDPSGSNRTDGRPYPACRRRKIIQCGGVMK